MSAAERLALAAYTLAWWLLLPLLPLRLWWRGRKEPAYRQHVGERFGRYPARLDDTRPLIWVHAVSAGETRGVEPLIHALRERYPGCRLLLTHMTPTGRSAGTQLFAADAAAGDFVQAYLPYDLPGAAGRFLDHFRPSLGLIMETEIWPNLLAAARRRGIPVALVNARLSARSHRGYWRVRALVAPALRGLAAVVAQTGEDATRLQSIGAPIPTISGNLKFDVTPPPALLTLGDRFRTTFSGNRPVFVWASTRDGEEDVLFEALRRRPLDAAIVVVPRHPQRFDAVAALAERYGFRVGRRSGLENLRPDCDVIVGDSMGEMYAYYTAADLAFIGGSLQPFGSQNPIEACAVGTPVIVGPSTFNFASAIADALQRGAARQIADAEEAIAVGADLLRDKPALAAMREAARQFAAVHRGATLRTLAALIPVVTQSPISGVRSSNR